VPQPIIYFEILGEDAELLRSYYSQLLGWRFDADVPPRGFDYALVRADDAGVGGGIGAAAPGTGGYLTFYVSVTDVETTLARAQELGGERIFGPDRVSDTLELGMFKDPEGHVVGVLANHDSAARTARRLQQVKSPAS
jgi:predicted enzyme related to lactoylglutathione lyase